MWRCGKPGRASIPRFPTVLDYPRYNKADIDWYMRKLTELPLVDPKVETLTQLGEEESATMEQMLYNILSV